MEDYVINPDVDSLYNTVADPKGGGGGQGGRTPPPEIPGEKVPAHGKITFIC